MEKGPSLAIEINGLRFSYARNVDGHLLAIDEWRVARGQQVFLHGPSGSGKTTLLSLLSGLLIAQDGEVFVRGQSLKPLNSSQRDQFRANHIGFIHQQFNLISYLSVVDNLNLAAHFSAQRTKSNNSVQRINTLMESLELPISLLQRKAAQLSVGQQQRVAIARAFINEPEIIIADEPTSALDADTKTSFINLLRNVVSTNSSTLIFVSHDHSLADHFDETVDLRVLNTREECSTC